MTDLSKPTNKMKTKWNETMKAKNSRLLFLAVDPCKESTQMNTKKETNIYNWIAVDHLRWSTQTQGKKSVQENYNCGTPK